MRYRHPRVYLALVFVLPLVLVDCAARQARTEDVALAVGEVALQLDRAEQQLADSQVISAEQHARLNPLVLRVLSAAQALVKVAQAGQPDADAFGQLRAAVAALDKAAGDQPVMRAIVTALNTVLNIGA